MKKIYQRQIAIYSCGHNFGPNVAVEATAVHCESCGPQRSFSLVHDYFLCWFKCRAFLRGARINKSNTHTMLRVFLNSMAVNAIKMSINTSIKTNTVRSLSSSVVLSAKKDPHKEKLASLKAQLKKEKDTYKTLKEKLAKEQKKVTDGKKKEKAKQAAAKEKAKNAKLLKQAFKNPRALSPFNMYVKGKGGVKLEEAVNSWKQLAEDEKVEFQELADKYNEELKATYAPKPKAPAFGFAAYVKRNFMSDGRAVAEILKELAVEWKGLPDSQKSAYAKDDKVWNDYQKELEAWKQERIALFNDKNSQKITL